MKISKKLRNLAMIGLIGLSSLIPLKVHSTEPVKGDKIGKVEIGLDILGSWALATGLHELGHYTAQTAMDHNPKFNGPSYDNSDNSLTFASVEHDYGSRDQELFGSLAGVASTRIDYEILNQLIKKDKIPERIKPFASTLALCLRLDLPRYLTNDSVRYFIRNEDHVNDVTNVVDKLFNSTKPSPKKTVTYAGLLALEGLDLYFDRKEIKNHFNQARGKEVDFNKKDNLDFGLIYDGEKLGLSINYKF